MQVSKLGGTVNIGKMGEQEEFKAQELSASKEGFRSFTDLQKSREQVMEEQFGQIKIENHTREQPRDDLLLKSKVLARTNAQLVAPNDQHVKASLQELDDAVWEGRQISMVNHDIGDFNGFSSASHSKNPTHPNKNTFQQDHPQSSYMSKRSDSSGWETVKTAFENVGGKSEKSSEPVEKENSFSARKLNLGPSSVVRATADGLETYPITPLRLDYEQIKQPRPQTPSVHSGNSVFDESSPLFFKSCKSNVRTNRNLGEVWEEYGSSASSSFEGSEEHLAFKTKVIEWLEDVDVKLPTLAENDNHQTLIRQIEEASSILESPRRRPFDVMQNGKVDQNLLQEPKRPKAGTRALKDLSNLRRPVLPRQKPQEGMGNTSTSADKTSLFSFEPNPERRAHFEFTLARLEGRVSPKSPSPIRRYADPSGYYGNNVEWERRPTNVLQPIPLRTRKIEASFYGTIDLEDESTDETPHEEKKLSRGNGSAGDGKDLNEGDHI